jgi:hypothetical protein
MTERVPEPYQPQGWHTPREPTPEEAHSNMLFGLGLFAIFLVLFAGTIGVALVYLALD